jgi:hypothetical protein
MFNSNTWSWRGKGSNSRLGARIQLHTPVETTLDAVHFNEAIYKVSTLEVPGFSFWELLRFESKTHCDCITQDATSGVFTVNKGYYVIELNVYLKSANDPSQRRISIQWGKNPPPSSGGCVDTECIGGPYFNLVSTRLISEPTELRVWTCGIEEDSIDTDRSNIRLTLITQAH